MLPQSCLTPLLRSSHSPHHSHELLNHTVDPNPLQLDLITTSDSSQSPYQRMSIFSCGFCWRVLVVACYCSLYNNGWRDDSLFFGRIHHLISGYMPLLRIHKFLLDYHEKVVSLYACVPFGLITEDVSWTAIHLSSELKFKYVIICRAGSRIGSESSWTPSPSILESHAHRRATVIVSKHSPSRRACDHKRAIDCRRILRSLHFVAVIARGRMVPTSRVNLDVLLGSSVLERRWLHFERISAKRWLYSSKIISVCWTLAASNMVARL